MEEESQFAKDAKDSREVTAMENSTGQSSSTDQGENGTVDPNAKERHASLPTMEQLDSDVKCESTATEGSAVETETTEEITVKVKLIDGKSFELLQVPLSSTVDELKTLIKAETDILEENQRIIHHGKVLNSGQLKDHKLKDPAWIHLVFRDPNIRPANSAAEAEQTEDTANRQTPEEITTSLAAIISSAIRTSNRAPAAQPLSAQSTEVHPLQPRDFNLEHLWQSLRTVDSIVDSYDGLQPFSEREEVKEDSAEVRVEGLESIYKDEDFEVCSGGGEENVDDETKVAGEECADVPSLRRFEKGQWVDVLDTVNQWLEATVMQVSDDGMKIKVHYNAWGERWDEVIDIRSRRIAPFRTKTKHRRTGDNLSATPVSWVKNAPRIGEGGLEELLPRALQSVERSLSVYRQVCSEGSRQNNVDGLLYLAPLLDRTGRMLGDIATKLAQRPRLVPSKQTLPVWPFSAVKQSILPFSLYISETDKTSTERDRLMHARMLDSDFLQLVNQQPDNAARTGNLDIHIHAIVSPGQELGASLGAASANSPSTGS